MNEKQMKATHDEYVELCTQLIRRCKDNLEKGNPDKYWHRLKFFVWGLMYPERNRKPDELITDEEWEHLCELNEAILADCYSAIQEGSQLNQFVTIPLNNPTRGLRAGTVCRNDIGYVEGDNDEIL